MVRDLSHLTKQFPAGGDSRWNGTLKKKHLTLYKNTFLISCLKKYFLDLLIILPSTVHRFLQWICEKHSSPLLSLCPQLYQISTTLSVRHRDSHLIVVNVALLWSSTGVRHNSSTESRVTASPSVLHLHVWMQSTASHCQWPHTHTHVQTPVWAHPHVVATREHPHHDQKRMQVGSRNPYGGHLTIRLRAFQ